MLFVKFTNCRTPSFMTLQLNCHLRSDGIMGASPFLFMPWCLGVIWTGGFELSLATLFVSRHKHYDGIVQLESDGIELLFELIPVRLWLLYLSLSFAYNLNGSHATAVGSKQRLADYVAVEATGSGCCNEWWGTTS